MRPGAYARAPARRPARERGIDPRFDPGSTSGPTTQRARHGIVPAMIPPRRLAPLVDALALGAISWVLSEALFWAHWRADATVVAPKTIELWFNAACTSRRSPVRANSAVA